MIIHIDPQADIPIYTQLTNQILLGIAKGDLHHGDSLPSVRTFAADLGVNMHTVNKSYHELEEKGIIQIVPKSGAVIRSPKQVVNGDITYQRLLEELKPMIAEALVIGMEQKQIEELVTSIILDLKGK